MILEEFCKLLSNPQSDLGVLDYKEVIILIKYLSLLLGVLILVPILYLFPLRLNNKIKLQLVLASLLVSVLGMLSSSIMEWWQTSLILFLLAGLLAYFIGKKNAPIEEGIQTSTLVAIGQSSFIPIVEADKGDALIEPEVGTKDPAEQPEVIDDVVLPENTSDIENDELALSQMDWFPQDESLELARRVELQGPIENTEDPINHSDEPLEPLIEDGDKRSEIFEALEEWTPDIDVEEPVSHSSLQLEMEEAVQPSEIEIEIPVLESESLKSDKETKLEEEGQLLEEADQVLPDYTLTRAILESMLEELHSNKKLMSSDDFETYAQSHLIPTLPDLDYYLFASILRDHYLETEQADKLLALLISLEERFYVYEPLREEIQFFKKQYSKY